MKLLDFMRAKYAILPEPQKKPAIICVVFFSLLVVYLVVHFIFTILFNHNNSPIQPMMIRKGSDIIIPADSPLRDQMKIEAVKILSIPHVLSFPGVVESDPSTSVAIFPPVTGRLMKIFVSLGDFIDENQVLALISSPDLAQAYTDNDKAISALNLTSAVLTRAQEVRRVGGNSVQSVQSSENDYRQAVLEAARTSQRLKILGESKDSLLTIRSPIAGRLMSINYGVGSYLTDPTKSLMSISNNNSVWVTANVPENFVKYLKKSQSADIILEAYPNEVRQGKISFISPMIEPDTHMNKTRILLDNKNGKLQPNMYATVKISIEQPPLIMIPTSSVLMNNDTTSVYVESSPWVCQRREVQLGNEDGDQVRVLSGLKAGEHVVSCGGVFIND